MRIAVTKTAMLCAFVALGCASCVKTIEVKPPKPCCASPQPAPPTPSSVEGEVVGTIAVGGHAWETPYSNSSSGAADTPVSLQGTSSGDEDNRSNRADHNHSYALSSGSFTPIRGQGGGVNGFTLAAAIDAHGGHVHDAGVFRNRSFDTNADATASVTGNLVLTKTGGAADAVLLHVTGNDAASVQHCALKVVGPDGQELVPRAFGSSLVMDLAAPGPYVVIATLSASAAVGGNQGTQVSNWVTVAAQALSSALQPVSGGATVSGVDRIALPVFASLEDVSAALAGSVFGRKGRFYPCRQNEECADDAADIYLEHPELRVENGWLVLKLHLNGNGVAGDIYMEALPAIDSGGDALKLDPLHVSADSDNAITKLIEARYGRELEAKLKERARIPLSAQFLAAEQKLAANFPLKWGPVCLTLDSDHPAIRSVKLANEGISAELELGLKPNDASACASPVQAHAPPN